ncbi:MAG: ABC transporter permease subunit, partial [Candidatus Bipolaricaulota bacterium]
MRWRGGAAWALALLPLAFLAIGFFWPLADVLRLGLQVGGRWTGDRLAALLSDPYVRRLLLFTFEQAALSSLLALALGFPLGWFLTRYRFPGRSLLRAFTIVPFVLPSITVALGFILFFGRAGHLNRLLMGAFGLGEPPIRVLYTLWAVVLAHAFYNAPVVARFVNAAWERVDPTLIEAARALGARPAWAFLTVTLPLLLPAVASALALVFVLCTLSFTIPLALGGARYATVEVGVYLYARGVLMDFPRAAALATITLGVSLVLTYLYLRGGGMFQARQGGLRPSPTVPLFSRERRSRLLWLLYLVPTALIFLGPIGAVVADSFLRPAPGGGTPTLHWYRLIVSPAWNPFIESSPLDAVRTSLLVAAGTTLLALVLGLAVSAVLRRVRSKA